MRRSRRTRIGRLCARLGIAVLLLVIAVCAPLTLPRLFGIKIYTVVSGSMEPGIPMGSLLYIREALPETIESGDVIAFSGGNGDVIAHRVVENRVVDGTFLTKGDANAQPDLSPVPYASLLGKAETATPYLGYLARLLSGTWGKLTSLFLILSAVLLHAAGSALQSTCQEDAGNSTKKEPGGS